MNSRFRPLLGIATASIALVLAGCGDKADDATAANTTAPATAVAPPAGSDWTMTVSQTPDGGFIMGNPDAPVKLVEYLSLTCSHCAEFASKAFAPLRDGYIKKGTVSFEIRNYVRDPIDVSAALVTRCNGAEPYFQMTEQMLAGQGELLAKAQTMSQAQFEQIGKLPPADQFRAIAAAVGIDQFARQRGVGADKINQCLGDKAALDKLVEMQKFANEQLKLEGTPTFLINGAVVPNIGTWEALKPHLDQAGG